MGKKAIKDANRQVLTTDQIFKKLANANIEPEEIATCMNMIHLLADVIETRSMNYRSLLFRAGLQKLAEDQDLKLMLYYAKRVKNSADKYLNDRCKEEFGDLADFYNELLPIAGKAHTDEDRLKIISNVKLIIKEK